MRCRFLNKGYQSCMNCGEGFKYFDVIHDGRWWPSKPHIPWKYGFLWFDGLRDLRDRFWRGLLSKCTMALAKQEVQLIWIGRAVRRSPGALWHCDNKPRQIGLNRDYNMTFWICPVNVSILHLKDEYGARSESRFACYFHAVTSRGAPKQRVNCRLIVPGVKVMKVRRVLMKLLP